MNRTATVADFRYERIGGAEKMFAQPSIAHISIARNLTYILYGYLRGKRCQLFTEADVVFDENHHFIPDLLIVCDKSKIRRDCIDGAPDMIVEILSLSTQKNDMGIKKDVYEKFGVKEYWIVDPFNKSVTVYHLRDNRFFLDNIYRAYSDEELADLAEDDRNSAELTLKVSLYDDCHIDVRDIFENIM